MKIRYSKSQSPEERKAYFRDYSRRWRAAHPERVREIHKAWRRRNPEKAVKWSKDNSAKIRLAMLKKKYGLTPEAYQAMLDVQRNSCSICLELFAGKVCVDHCHTTGKVRGLLCAGCNSGLGHFKDCPERMVNAANYIKRFLLTTGCHAANG